MLYQRQGLGRVFVRVCYLIKIRMNRGRLFEGRMFQVVGVVRVKVLRGNVSGSLGIVGRLEWLELSEGRFEKGDQIIWECRRKRGLRGYRSCEQGVLWFEFYFSKDFLVVVWGINCRRLRARVGDLLGFSLQFFIIVCFYFSRLFFLRSFIFLLYGLVVF